MTENRNIWIPEKMNKLKSFSITNTAALLEFLVPILVFIILTRTPQDADMWWHLSAGQTMWQSRTILLHDIFSYTRYGQPWVNAFWVSEIILYLCYKLGGFFSITTLVALIGAMTFYAIYRSLGGNKLINAFVVVLAALTAAPIWSPRPQIFSFLIFALLDVWLTQTRRRWAGRLWILIPIFAIWSNIHGGWIWGFLLLLSVIVGVVLNNLSDNQDTHKDWKFIISLASWSLAAGLAIGLNPNGIALWRLPFYTADVSMQIQEWMSPNFHVMEFQPMLWMIFLLIVTGVLGKPKVDWASLFKVIGFAYLTFVSERSIAIFAIATTPVLAEWTNGAIDIIKTNLPKREKVPSKPLFSDTTRMVLNASVLAVIGLIALTRAYLVSSTAQVNQYVPVGAIQWLKTSDAQGPLFNSYNWGGYLTWSLPRFPVFIDGRADLYGIDLINQWWSVVDGTPQGFQILNQWNIRTILLEPDWPIVSLLPSAGWHEVYRDIMAVIFIKDK